MSICLNMIVKNEERVIKRCLTSVAPIIDFFVIMDTGSTDNTVKLIKEFFSERKIKGIIKQGEFKNFSQARNKSLSIAYGKCKCDYIFFIDADMVLDVRGEYNLELDSYYITQGDGRVEYKNMRIIRNDRNCYYKGYTHEVILPLRKEGFTMGYLPQMHITDYGDGGSKSDKLSRDIRLLSCEINEDPQYTRPYFYLANTYFGKGDLSSAEKYYRIRIGLGGWKEEIWYCYYKLAMIKILEKKIPEAIWFLFSSIETHQQRLESYFHLLFLLRESRMDKIYETFREKALDIYEKKFETTDYLFYEKELCEIEIKKLIK